MNTHAAPITTAPHHVGMQGYVMYEGGAHHAAAATSSVQSYIYTYPTYSTELLEIQRILNVPRYVGFLIPASSRRRPGRGHAAHRPCRPISPRAPVGPVTTSRPISPAAPRRPRHRTHDPMVEARRPGMSALGHRQHARTPASALPCPKAGHRGVTDPSVATGHHEYRTRQMCSRTCAFPDLTTLSDGEGVREKAGPITVYHPLCVHCGQHFDHRNFGFSGDHQI